MRHKGSISEVQVERNKVVVEKFKAIKRECRHDSIYDICAEIAESPVNRFYLSEERAYVIYMQWLMYGEVEVKSPHKMLLYLDFIRICDEMPRNGRSVKDIIWEALQQPAPILGVGIKQAIRIVSTARKK